jgi:hypothetical protein
MWLNEQKMKRRFFQFNIALYIINNKIIYFKIYDYIY